MANITPTLKQVQGQAEQTVRHAAPWVERMARLGYGAKGIVYIVVGFLAFEAAFTGGGKTTNSKGALTTIFQQPYGQFLLAIVGIGLAGYALWRFVEAVLDSENKGSDPRGIATRLGYVCSGIGYGLLSFTAFQLITGAAQSATGSAGTQDWTAKLLSLPFGQVLVGLIGLVVIGSGIGQFVTGYKADFDKQLKLDEIPQAFRSWAVFSGRWGYMAQGVVFAILGGFIVEAAVHANAQKAKGIGSALDLLAEQSYGPILLGIVAIGLISYGIFMLVEARYRRIQV
ncbi:MAG: hypothetical protein JWL77_2811 [Chthonomonadaceae bacterium]|nr:hypothetical protein [Chthonomonadaceae bacterium]